MRKVPIHFPEPALTRQQCAVLVLNELEKQRRRRGGAAEEAGLRAGLSAYWKLDGPVGGVWPDSHGTHDLAEPLDGPPISAVTGLLNGAQTQADGPWVLGHHLQTALTADLETTGDFTLSAWICPTARDWQSEPIYRTGGEDPLETTWSLFFGTNVWEGSGELYFTLYGVDMATSSTCAAATPTLPSVWSHCVAVREGTALRIYLNGVEDTVTGSVPAGFAMTSGIEGGVAQIGTTGGDQNFPGLIDEIGFWQRALSAAEVAQLYNSGLGLAYELF